MRIAEVQADYRVADAESAMPPLPPGGALIRLLGCGLCGSDLDKIVNRKAPPGTVLGHEVVGVIETLDTGHPAGFSPGDRIVVSHHTPCGTCRFCQADSESMCRQFKQSNLVPGGFSQYIALSAAHLQKTAFQVPAGVSDAAASSVEPLACVLRAVRRLALAPGQSVAVLGLGFIGLMAAQVFAANGQTLIGVEPRADRRRLAIDRGWTSAAFCPQDDAEALADQSVDAVFLSVVTPRTLALALSLVRDGGRLMLFTSAPPETALDPSVLYFREINVLTSYSPALADLQAASRWIFEGRIDVDTLVTHQRPLSRLEEALALYRSGEALKVLITPDEASKHA